MRFIVERASSREGHLPVPGAVRLEDNEYGRQCWLVELSTLEDLMGFGPYLSLNDPRYVHRPGEYYDGTYDGRIILLPATEKDKPPTIVIYDDYIE